MCTVARMCTHVCIYVFAYARVRVDFHALIGLCLCVRGTFVSAVQQAQRARNVPVKPGTCLERAWIVPGTCLERACSDVGVCAQSLNAYIIDSYASDGTAVGAYAPDASKIVVAISGAKFSPGNFWNGRMRSSWQVGVALPHRWHALLRHDAIHPSHAHRINALLRHYRMRHFEKFGEGPSEYPLVL